MTFWVCGTSVSIKRGYVDHLTRMIAPEQLENISIGDESSLMGLMRVHSVQHKFARGDVLVWEFPLLDIFLPAFMERRNYFERCVKPGL
jgi:hypothetical protein